MDFELVAGISAVVVIIGIIEALKGIFNLEPKYAPIVAVAEIKHILKTGGDQYVGKDAVEKH